MGYKERDQVLAIKQLRNQEEALNKSQARETVQEETEVRNIGGDGAAESFKWQGTGTEQLGRR